MRDVKNKAVLCKPLTLTKATYCKPHMQSKLLQTGKKHNHEQTSLSVNSLLHDPLIVVCL